MISPRHSSALLVLAATLSFFVFAGTASAATTVGQTCNTNSGAPLTIFQSSVSAGASYTVPSSGVITKWGANRTGSTGTSIGALIFGTNAGGQWTITKRTPFESIPESVSTEFPARLSVAAGEVLGITIYNSTAFMCNSLGLADVIDYNGSFSDVGAVFAPTQIPQVRLPVWATLEADADLDGYGDETQDKCPQSAEFQNPCPVLAISQQLSANAKQISILATASVNASLTATAKVKVGRKTVTIKGKATAFTAGKLKTIKLKLPSSVKSALKSGKKLTASVTLTGSGLANTATVTGKVKLRK